MWVVALVKSLFFHFFFGSVSNVAPAQATTTTCRDRMDFPRNDQLVIDLGGVHNPMEPLVFGRYGHWEGEESFPPKRRELRKLCCCWVGFGHGHAKVKSSKIRTFTRIKHNPPSQ